MVEAQENESRQLTIVLQFSSSEWLQGEWPTMVSHPSVPLP